VHSASTVGLPWWQGKDEIKEYLENVNKGGKVSQLTFHTISILYSIRINLSLGLRVYSVPTRLILGLSGYSS
jgi:hypothetical protein